MNIKSSLQAYSVRLSLTLDGSNSFMYVPPSSEAQTPQPGTRPGFMGRQPGASVNLNPVGSGGNYIPFGMLCDIGFSAEAGQKASFSEVMVSNNRLPNATLFAEDLSAMVIMAYIQDLHLIRLQD